MRQLSTTSVEWMKIFYFADMWGPLNEISHLFLNKPVSVLFFNRVHLFYIDTALLSQIYF